MPRLIVAGVPRPVVQRNAGYNLSFEGWEVLLFHSRSKRVEVAHCWSEVIEAAHATGHGGAHLLCFDRQSSYEDTRHKYEKGVGRCHRLLWPNSQMAVYFGTPGFHEFLQAIVEFEAEWRAKVRPHGLESPLFLPETHFEARTEDLNRLWERSYSVRKKKDDVRAIQTLANHFRRHHYRAGHWRDAHDLLWRRDASYHGKAPPDRRWKYTFELPPGFHYDVTHAHGRGFYLADEFGYSRRFLSHANVDCHGHVL